MRAPEKVSERRLFDPIWKKSATLEMFVNARTGAEYEWPIFRVALPPVNIVFALTASFEVIVIRKFQHGADMIMTELPGGLCDGGELAEDGGRRELLEETGYEAASFCALSSEPIYFEPGSLDFRFKPFLALDCRRVAGKDLDENEDIEVLLTPLQEWLDGIASGAILTDAKSMATTFLAVGKLDIGVENSR